MDDEIENLKLQLELCKGLFELYKQRKNELSIEKEIEILHMKKEFELYKIIYKFYDYKK